MAKNNTNLTEPRSLTWTGLWSLHKGNLIAWATGHCLLEHLDADEVAGMTKDQIVEECMGAFLRIEVDEDRRGHATEGRHQPKSVGEVIG